MRRSMLHAVVVCWGWTVLFTTPLLSQAILKGTVRQDSTGRPLAGVEVLLEASGRQTTTDQAGRYVLNGVPTSSETVLFRLIGYRPMRQRVVMPVGDTVWLNVELVPRGPQELEPVEVTAVNPAPMGLREGFEERRKMGFGKFLDLETLKKNEHRKLSDLLQGIQGVRMIWWDPCFPIPQRICVPPSLAAASTRLGANCWMSVYVDGFPIYESRSSPGRPPPDLSSHIQVHQLDAVEVYRSSAELPGEFSGANSQCGVVALWTRRAR